VSIISKYKKRYEETEAGVITLEDYLKQASEDPTMYATPAQRLLKAIEDAQLIDTSTNPRLGRIFGNRTIRVYDAFKEIYGLEAVIERIVAFYKHSAQGLEEKNQALCLRGPVGSAKSTIAELLKALMEKESFYALEGSPIHESPLGLFEEGDSHDLGIPVHALQVIPSPWALKRIKEYKGDLSRFNVVKLKPSKYYQIAIAKTEPGDENTQDISVLTGKLDIRQLEHHSQDDPDAYSYSGGLCKSHRGMLDFVEMLKSPLKTLHPLLTALQEHNYTGTEAIGPIPYDGLILSHFNEHEWDKFKNDSKNEALLDRFCIVDVPYNLRKNEEIKIFQKLINHSELTDAPCAPHTYECLANFTILSKLSEPENSNIYSKLHVYNGEDVRDKDTRAKSMEEYRQDATRDEGFFGVSTRTAYKLLAETFNYHTELVEADPVHLFVVLRNWIQREKLTPDVEETFYSFLDYVEKRFYTKLGKDIQACFIEQRQEYLQNAFEHYIARADAWTQDTDYKDPDTGFLVDRKELDDLLSEVEKPAGIANPKDFRHELINWCLRYRASKGKMPNWDVYSPMRRVLEKTLFEKVDDLLPILSAKGTKSKNTKARYKSFTSNMQELGYTDTQVQRLVDAYVKYKKAE
jgi:serine protein kinase